MATLIRDHSAQIKTTAGLGYRVRVYGQPQSDGMWLGWLEFRPAGGIGPVLRTSRETSQVSREALDSWASGLEMAYFEGAFGRAQVVS
jgi:hypothetical protein